MITTLYEYLDYPTHHVCIEKRKGIYIVIVWFGNENYKHKRWRRVMGKSKKIKRFFKRGEFILPIFVLMFSEILFRDSLSVVI